jgi:hypothetical protein
VNYFKDLLGRLSQSRRWVVAQLIGTPLLIFAGIAWTRLPEKHLWQVALSLLVPVLLAISVLELNAGTMRNLAGNDGKRVKLVWGAVTLLVWIAVVWISWTILDWCDGQSFQWASYLNSQAPAHLRARFFTYDHVTRWITILVWIFRWIVVPAKVIPYAIASAQSGYRLPWRRVLQLLWNWRWWPAVVVAALLGVWLPGLFFAPDPHGTLSAQIWRVSLKLAAAYLLAIVSWVALLAWAAVLFGRQRPLPENDALTELFKRLRDSRRWIFSQFCWILVFAFMALTASNILSHFSWGVWVSMPLLLLLLVAGVVAQAGTMRSLLNDGEKRIRMVWGTLSMLFWMVTAFGIVLLVVASHSPILTWVVGWVLVPAFFVPVVATSANWGFLLPWRKLLRLMYEWRWWLGLVAALVVGVALPCLINAAMQSGNTTPSLWIEDLRVCGIGLLAMGSWVLLLGWLAVLIDRSNPKIGDALAVVPGQTVQPEIKQEEPVKPTSPEGD